MLNGKCAGLQAIMRPNIRHLYALDDSHWTCFRCTVPKCPRYLLQPAQQLRVILASNNSEILSSLYSLSCFIRNLS